MTQRIGKFEVTELLGRGAMGMVYKGFDPALARPVAIKVMTAHLEMDPELRTRFFREAQAAGSLQHPNIITVYELGDSEGQPYIAMEYVPGRDLDDIISAREPLTVVEKVDLIEQVCRGLAFAHERRIVHRDVKPANIRVTEVGQVKLMDFGVAHLISSELTQTGSLMGTPYYMAPEVINGKPVDARADIFSLGATFYELLTYSRPFQGENLQTVFRKILHESPAPLRDLGYDTPPILQKVLDRSLAKNPADRYADTAAFLGDVMQFWETIPSAAQARAAASTALGAAAAKAAGAARRRWRMKKLIPLAAAASIGLAGLVIVGGPLVSSRFSSSAPPDQPGSTEVIEQVAVPVDGPEVASPLAAAETAQAAAEPTQPSEASVDPVQPSPQPQPEAEAQPERTAEADRRAEERRRIAALRNQYQAANQAAGDARSRAVAVAAANLAGASFGRGESLRQSGSNLAERGRYEQASQRMEEARIAYDDARGTALGIWRARVDSAWTDLLGLREQADAESPSYARATQLWQQAEGAEAERDFQAALVHMRQAAEALRQAVKPVVTEPLEEAAEPAERSVDEIVEETLGTLRRAIEAENMTALRRVWPGLTVEEGRKFESFFRLVRDLSVTFDVESVRRAGDRLEVNVRTRYDFINESNRRREQLTEPQRYLLAEQNGRWIVLDN